MSNAIYPTSPTQIRALTWTVMKTATMQTIVQQSANGVTLRIAQWQNPIWHFTLLYEVLFDNPLVLNPGNSVTEYRLLQGFWLARQGQFDDFLYDDPTDDSVGPALLGGGSPNPQAELQLVTDG